MSVAASALGVKRVRGERASQRRGPGTSRARRKRSFGRGRHRKSGLPSGGSSCAHSGTRQSRSRSGGALSPPAPPRSVAITCSPLPHDPTAAPMRSGRARRKERMWRISWHVLEGDPGEDDGPQAPRMEELLARAVPGERVPRIFEIEVGGDADESERHGGEADAEIDAAVKRRHRRNASRRERQPRGIAHAPSHRAPRAPGPRRLRARRGRPSWRWRRARKRRAAAARRPEGATRPDRARP